MLQTIYKNRFHFRIGAPSYIYPEGYVPNVEKLAPYLDEIELIFFESHPQSFPSDLEIDTLKSLAHQHQIKYLVHLPIDFSILDLDQNRQDKAIEAIFRIMQKTKILPNQGYVLHLPFDKAQYDSHHLKPWEKNAFKILERIFNTIDPAAPILIETLDYPFFWIEDIINAFNLSVCFDIGHFMVHKMEIEKIYNLFETKIEAVHLHGNTDIRDHLGLSLIPDKKLQKIFSLLNNFKKTLILEVFSIDNLLESLSIMDNYYNHYR